MRALLDGEKAGDGPWNLKHAPGGLVDIEFLVQALQLGHAAETPEILYTATVGALDRARRHGLLDEEDWEILREAARLQQNLTQILRLALDGPFKPDTAGEGLKQLLARIGGAPDFSALAATLAESQKAVRAIFLRIIKTLG
jgi:glutamate-ammonia-ligase adenylyltransferase